MKADEPHVFDPIPEVPIAFPRTGPANDTEFATGVGGVLGKVTTRLCRICRRPEDDRLHAQADETTDEPKHWG
jgi:hypothetical protein